MPAATGLVLSGADAGDERLGDARVGAVEAGVVADIGFLPDLESGDVLTVVVDELLDERAVSVDVAGA